MPAIGDLFKGSAELTTGVPVDIRPASGCVARIHYILHSANLTVNLYDGSASREVPLGAYGANGIFGQALPIDNGMYLKVSGLTGTKVAWLGVYTKV